MIADFYTTAQDTAEVLSLALTVPTILLALVVVFVWAKETIKAFGIPAKERTSAQWLIIGVAVSFIGMVLDNSYWGAAWTASFEEWGCTGSLFESGVFANIPFRQGTGIFAAYCHLRSYGKFVGKDANLIHLLYATMLLGLGVVIVLILIRG